MTQNELIWALFTFLQVCVFAFVGYWTRRVQRLEERDYENVVKIARLEAQFAEILKSLTRIELRQDKHEDHEMLRRERRLEDEEG